MPARLENYPGARHGFFNLLATTPESGQAVGAAAEALRAAFTPAPDGENDIKRQPPDIGISNLWPL